jgi:hypothetical protein
MIYYVTGGVQRHPSITDPVRELGRIFRVEARRTSMLHTHVRISEKHELDLTLAIMKTTEATQKRNLTTFHKLLETDDA